MDDGLLAIYQNQLKKEYDPNVRNSDVAQVLGDRTNDVAANFEAALMDKLWPLGHDYANRIFEIAGSICIGIQTGRCTISIDPFFPMVPSVTTYYAPKK